MGRAIVLRGCPPDEMVLRRRVEAGNEARLAAVERYLGEWLAKVPDEGENEEEREILRRARAAQ